MNEAFPPSSSDSFLTVPGTALHQLAGLGRAGEGQLADDRVQVS